MNKATLSLGSNLGNKKTYLQQAVNQINKLGNVTDISTIYQTPAWGFSSDDFYNIALILTTDLSAVELLENLLLLEKQIGRIRNEYIDGYQARVIDIDIIFFNDEIINTEQLTIPHPKMHERKFVLVPIVEIDKTYIHPIYLKDTQTLLENCLDDSEILNTSINLKGPV